MASAAEIGKLWKATGDSMASGTPSATFPEQDMFLFCAGCSKLQAGLWRVWAAFSSKECKEGKSRQTPRSRFFGLRMGRDSWWLFIGLEVSLNLL